MAGVPDQPTDHDAPAGDPEPPRRVDGPAAVGDGCIPSIPPPEKNPDKGAKSLNNIPNHVEHISAPFGWSKTGKPLKPHGRFISNSEFAKKHTNVRTLPKPDGWRPYRGNASFSLEDIQHVRASADDARILARMYGVGVGTIKRIRGNRSAKVLTRWESQRRVSELDLPSGELARMMADAMTRVTDQFRHPLRLALAKERRVAGRLTRRAREKLKEQGRKAEGSKRDG